MNISQYSFKCLTNINYININISSYELVKDIVTAKKLKSVRLKGKEKLL